MNADGAARRRGAVTRGGFLVSHPHAGAVANHTAGALARADILVAYLAGWSAAQDSLRGEALRYLARFYPVLSNRLVPGISPRQLRSLALIEAAARLAGRASHGLGAWAPDSYDAMFVAHDAAAALMPWPAAATGVYAFEDAAARTFRRAAARGLDRVYHLAAPYFRSVEEVWHREHSRWPGAMPELRSTEPGWKRRRKDRELHLATHVTVASQYARKSLERFGPFPPVSVIPYGFPVDEFQARSRRPSGPFTVMAVGTQDLRKGTQYLLAAWKRADLSDARLLLVGRLGLSSGFLGDYAGRFEHVPHVPRARLPDLYRAADVLVFPTLSDGFGLVIQEAMSCGVPVVTTECGGGPECITHGSDGWLVPAARTDSLVDTLRWLAADRERCYEAGQAARHRAERWTWLDSGQALVRALVPEHGTGQRNEGSGEKTR